MGRHGNSAMGQKITLKQRFDTHAFGVWFGGYYCCCGGWSSGSESIVTELGEMCDESINPCDLKRLLYFGLLFPSCTKCLISQ
jgi:hypothetical protein